MTGREIRTLQEAYMEVVENQQLDEAKREEGAKVQENLYDIILSHLLDERYAETPEAAEVIIANMSENWQEVIIDSFFDEATRYSKETGKSFKTGKKRVEGGSMKDDEAYKRVQGMMRRYQGRPEGQKPKKKGEKPPVAGELGGPKSPSQKVSQRRSRKKESEEMMTSRFD